MSEFFIPYIIEGTLTFSVLYLMYQLFLAQYKNLQFNRLYLLFTGIFSLVLPVIHIPIYSEPVSKGGMSLVIQLPTVIINSAAEQLTRLKSTEYNLTDIILLIYCIGLLIMLISIFTHAIRIVKFIKANQKYAIREKKYQLIPTRGQISTCSFFSYLLWDDTINLSEKENRFVLEHELVHIKQRHSLDVIFSELFSLFFWFNPLSYMFKNSIKATHEFIADDAVISPADKDKYLSILSSHTLKNMRLVLGNNFYQTQIFKRMNMIKTEKKRSWLSRMFLTLPIVTLLIYLFACESKDAGDNQLTLPDGYAWIKADEAPENVQNEFKKLDREDFGILYYQGEFNGKAKEFAESINPKIIEVRKENELTRVYLIASKNLEITPATERKPLAVNEFDESPLPEGGFETFYNHIGRNIRYPSQARENGIEGKVFVEFIVTQDGTLDSMRVVKGIGYGCDEEAMRAIKSFDKKWNPGILDDKPVNTKMVLPITFKLGGSSDDDKNTIEMKMESKTDGQKKEKNEVEEMVVVGYK